MLVSRDRFLLAVLVPRTSRYERDLGVRDQGLLGAMEGLRGNRHIVLPAGGWT